jgi:hypothetical protein
MPEIPSDLQLFVFSAIKTMATEIRADEDKQRKPLEDAIKTLLEERQQHKGIMSLVTWGGWATVLALLAKHYLKI